MSAASPANMTYRKGELTGTAKFLVEIGEKKDRDAEKKFPKRERKEERRKDQTAT